MRTRIFFNHQTGERFTLSDDEVTERRNKQDSAFILKDINSAYPEGGIRSPIDGSFITSRSQLRRHNNTHQVRCAGDFKKGELIAKERARKAETVRRAEGGSVEWK